jgi:carbonic anhydrase/acetyltransferase-like protein (isoleucine patch superfamily)
MSGAVTPASIHPSVFVAPGAIVLGDVTIGPGASVWFNTVVRGDSAPVVVGADSNLQDNSVVHEDEGFPAQIGERVTVGHRSIVHGCVIEDDCLIGMGAVILTGARIGTGSLVGAASLVREHQIIPPGSLVVGSPARIVGPAGPQHRAAILNGATHYAELARTYMGLGLARSAGEHRAVTGDPGPMTRREWRSLVLALEEGPSWVAGRAASAAIPGWAERSSRLAALDRERLALVVAIARGETVLDAAATAPPREPPDSEGWPDARARLCRLLESLGPEAWVRIAGHRERGAMTLGDRVRDWVEDDLAWRSGIAAPRSGRA